VEHYPINAFDPKLDQSVKLAIARGLQRMWSDVLQEPLPTDLRRVIDKLEQVTGGRSAAGSQLGLGLTGSS
jgi:hypothetical protein